MNIDIFLGLSIPLVCGVNRWVTFNSVSENSRGANSVIARLKSSSDNLNHLISLIKLQQYIVRTLKNTLAWSTFHVTDVLLGHVFIPFTH